MTSARNEFPRSRIAEEPSLLERYPAPREAFGLLDCFLILTRRLRFLVLFTVVCAAIGAVVSLLLPVEYTASVTILPPQQNSSLNSALAMQLAGLSSVSGLASSALGLKNSNDMYVAMLKSRVIENAVISQFGLMREYHKKTYYDARKALERHTEIEGSTKDGLIRVSFESRTPERASEIANAYVAQFRDLSQHLAITEAAQRRIIFQQQLEKTKDELADAEEALKRTELQTGMVQLDSQARAMIEAAARLRAQIVAKQVQIDAMKSYAANENPALAQAQTELDSLRAQFAKLVGSNGSGEGDLFLPKGEVPEAGLEYIRKLRDVKYYEAIFEILARQLELAKLDEAKEGGFIQIVDPASPPERKSFPKRMIITAAAAAVGLCLALMIAFFQATLARLRTDPLQREKLEEIQQAFREQLPIVQGESTSVEARAKSVTESRPPNLV